MPTIVLLVGFGVGLVLGLGGGIQALDTYKTDAINAGVAHYEVDPKTGTTTFVYECGVNNGSAQKNSYDAYQIIQTIP